MAQTGVDPSAPAPSWDTPVWDGARYTNPWRDPQDRGERAGPAYILRKAVRQVTGRQAIDGRPEVRRLDLEAMAAAPAAVAWLGHASMLVRIEGLWILVDPVLRPTIGPLPGLGPERITAAAIDIDALPAIDIVLISHDHFDHLDRPTLQAIAKRQATPPRVIGGKGLEDVVPAPLQDHLETLSWWESRTIGPVTLTFTPAQHGSGRSIAGRNRSLWGGWFIEAAGQRLYMAGDTADAPRLFETIRARLGRPTFAAIPVGAYAPREWMRFEHLDPEEAMAAFERVGARAGVGIHWGTFNLGEETPAQTREAFTNAQARRGSPGFTLWSVGETLALPPDPEGHPR